MDLDWDGCINVRDLGGFRTPAGPTASRVFVRADNARKLTDAGWHAAAEYGIRTVLDLRSEGECAADPPAREGFVHRRISLFDHFDGDAAYRADLFARVGTLDRTDRYTLSYREALQLDTRRFAEAIDVLAEAQGGVLFHCVGGKDRTGLLTAMLLRLVDVPYAEIEDDYVLTEQRARSSGVEIRHDVTAPRGVLTHVLGEVEQEHGSVAAFLERAGAPERALRRIREKLAPL